MGLAKIIRNHFSRSGKQPSTSSCEDKESSSTSRRPSLSPIRSNNKSSQKDSEYRESYASRKEREEEYQDESFEEARCSSPQLPFLNKRVRFDVLSDTVSHISEVTIYEESVGSNDDKYHQGFPKMSAANFTRYGTFRRPIKIYHTDVNKENDPAVKEDGSADSSKEYISNIHSGADTQQNAGMEYTRRSLTKLPMSPLNRLRSQERFSDTVSRISEMTIYEESVRSNDYDEIIDEDFTEINEDQINVAPSIIFVRTRNRRCQRGYKTITKKVIFV